VLNKIRNKFRKLCIALITAGVLLNAVAFVQAYKMTHFVETGQRTPKPEELGFVQKLALMFTGVNVPKPTGEWRPNLDEVDLTILKIPGYLQLELDVWHLAHSDPDQVIILWHGYAGEKTQIAQEAMAFYRNGHDVYLADFYGSGASAGNSTSIGFHEAEDVRAVYQVARERHPERKIVLYGVSMGANAILNAIDRLDITPDAAILAYPFSSLLSTTKNRFHLMGLPAFPAAHCLTYWGGLMHGFSAFDYEPAEYARNVKVPVLQLHGRLDERVGLAGARRVFDALSGPKTWVLFENTAHEPFLEIEPEKWHQSVNQFLDEIPSRLNQDE
jgi:alpha-beta hydrolase superfamily lysophospholipase